MFHYFFEINNLFFIYYVVCFQFFNIIFIQIDYFSPINIAI